jgi:agmatinase
MSKEEKIKEFNPNAPGSAGSNIYGLPFEVEDASIVIIPVPWEVTVSYNAGTAAGPQAIFDASFQVDLFDPYVQDAWKAGIAMEEEPQTILEKSLKLRAKAQEYIEMIHEGEDYESNGKMISIRSEINQEGEQLKNWLKKQALNYINQGKLVAVLGGDHSTPLGLMDALCEKHDSFCILQIDAHMDLRIAYEGFEYSHASIMYNALKFGAIEKLVQVGIRDFCEEEISVAEKEGSRIKTYYYHDIAEQKFGGKNWMQVCDEIVSSLSEKVYISFDIDGLDPRLCPHTGTPVPGGLEYDEAVYLIKRVVDSGKQIIGFDLNEVAPGETEWDANVGARLLYRLCNLMAKSNRIV